MDKPDQTKLGEKKRNVLWGSGIILFGVVVCVIGASFIQYVFGIFLTFGGGTFVALGLTMFRGRCEAQCPYCGAEYKLPSTAAKMKCRQCEKISIRDGEFLKIID